MRKKFKKSLNKILAILMIFGMLFQILAPTMVLAVTYQDANAITIGGTPTIEGNTFNYENGSVTVTKNNVPVNTTNFTVVQNDVIKIVLEPDQNYNAKLHNEVQNYDVQLTNNVFEFTIGNASSSTLSLTPSFVTPGGNDGDPIILIDFTLNGCSFEDVSVLDQVEVPTSCANFSMNTLNEFYITKIVNGNNIFEYSDGEYSYELLDNQGRHVLEANYGKISDNLSQIRVESHNNDIKEEDIANGKTLEDYSYFYLENIKFIKPNFKGIVVSTDVMPDNYDFTTWNGVDLGTTSIDNPGTVTAYYGEDTISLTGFNSDISPIESIELVEGKGVPSDAIEIDSTNGTIRILSNYYNQILVKVELEDGTIGYVNINRIGIFIGDLNKNQDTFYHGAVNSNVQGNLNVQTNKQRLVAVFYHENTTTYNDYDLIVNITYTDGTTETKIATGVGDVDNMFGDIVGSDYILWSGDSLGTIEKVSVTAVKKGAISNETTFGGATFGSGSGVIWEKG